MSTRANIIVKDEHSELWFYRHSDGYPEGTLPTLNRFMDYVKSGAIRDNAGQAAGWLIMIGAQEYGAPDLLLAHHNPGAGESPHSNWKAGAYEPTTEMHGDIDYLYTVDLKKKTVTVTQSF